MKAGKINDLGLDIIGRSLDGSDEKTHDLE